MSDDRQRLIAALIEELRRIFASPLRSEQEQAQDAQTLWLRHAASLAPVERQHVIDSVGAPRHIASVVFGDDVNNSNVAVANQGETTQLTNAQQLRDDAQLYGVMAQTINGNVYLNQSSSEVAGLPLEQQYLWYYAKLCSQLRQLHLPDDPDASDASQRMLRISDLYTRLEVGRRAPRPPDERDDAALLHSLLGVEAASQPGRADHERAAADTTLSVLGAVACTRRLIVLGDPGSGKTTFINFLVYCLAGALFHAASPPQGDAGAADRLHAEGWSDPLPIPILVRLNLWADWLGSHQAAASSSTDELASDPLWGYLAHTYTAQLVTDLRQQTFAGRTVLIFDGLDEVPLGAELARIKAHIAALAETSVARIVVACRVLDYQQPQRQLHDERWTLDQLQPLSPELRREFVQLWYAALVRLERQTYADADTLRKTLQRAIRERPDLRRLAGNPLLLTMMALLHTNKGRLPDDRVQLYNDCIELLLLRWRRKPGEPGLAEAINLPLWKSSDTLILLQHLAFAAHEKIDADQPGREQTFGGTDLTSAEVRTIACAVFEQYVYRDPAEDPGLPAARFLAYVERKDNGVLQVYEKGLLRFPHRTFQEYLAAMHLRNDASWNHKTAGSVIDRLLARAGLPAWHEVLLLTTSDLIRTGDIDRVEHLLTKLLADDGRAKDELWARKALLAGEILLELRRKPVPLDASRGSLYAETLARLELILNPTRQSWLHRRFAPAEGSRMRRLADALGPKPLLDARGRVAAGTVLGLLQHSERRSAQPLPAFLPIPAGTFLMGSDPRRDLAATAAEQPQHQVTLPTFYMAETPVTNAQYAVFISAGGYANSAYWGGVDSDGWRWRCQVGLREPYLWDNEAYNNPLQPVIGVSWYEACAYTAWLDTQEWPERPAGLQVRLPTEAEWEYAARGSDGRIYPWGERWQPDCANTDGFLSVPTPVGCFPAGASPFGLLDMAGNVWEWTLSTWRSYSNAPKEFEEERWYVMRGGSYRNNRTNVRCAARFRNFPDINFINFNYPGFRCVLAPRSHIYSNS